MLQKLLPSALVTFAMGLKMSKLIELEGIAWLGKNPTPVDMVNIPLFTGFYNVFIYPRWCRISSNSTTHPNLVEDVRPASSLATASVGNPAWETQMPHLSDLLLLGILEIQVLFEKQQILECSESQFLNFVFLARFLVYRGCW